MDELTAKLRARDRKERRAEVMELRRRAKWCRINRFYPIGGKPVVYSAALTDLVFAAQALHARRGTLNLPSTQRAIARYVF